MRGMETWMEPDVAATSLTANAGIKTKSRVRTEARVTAEAAAEVKVKTDNNQVDIKKFVIGALLIDIVGIIIGAIVKFALWSSNNKQERRNMRL
jgi:hypothetical protein